MTPREFDGTNITALEPTVACDRMILYVQTTSIILCNTKCNSCQHKFICTTHGVNVK